MNYKIGYDKNGKEWRFVRCNERFYLDLYEAYETCLDLFGNPHFVFRGHLNESHVNEFTGIHAVTQPLVDSI